MGNETNYDPLTINIFNVTNAFLLEEDINGLDEWYNNWNLPLNTKKCTALYFNYHAFDSLTMHQLSIQTRLKTWVLLSTQTSIVHTTTIAAGPTDRLI